MALNKKTKEETLETILFNCRDHLRGRAQMTDKRDLLLTLVFLKFIYDRFLTQQDVLKEKYKDKPDFLNNIVLNQASYYKQDGVFFLQDEYLWSNLISKPAKEMAVTFDNAIAKLEQNEETLKNALPQQLFTKSALEPAVLKSVVDEVNKIDRSRFNDKDLIGRVYEYFLQAFSINADKEEGEFYTPHSIVELIASLIEPFNGTLYDPCCGSGGMFVQSAKLIQAHGGGTNTIHVFGQESEPATYRLAKMNLAVRGISYDLGIKADSTFTNDQHSDKKVNYIMANPPFNLKNWWNATDKNLKDDPRWDGYGIPPESNANYAWILHMLSKLDKTNGVAGFLLANGALDDSDAFEIRKNLIERDKVEAIIVLPREMFYSTDISVTLWILNNNKRGGIWHDRKLRNREHEILFVDLRTWNQNIYEKKFVQFLPEQINDICKIYFDWQTGNFENKYQKPELYYSANIEELREKNYSLVPSRYIEFVDHDIAIDYKTALGNIGNMASDLLKLQKENSESLKKAFETLGYKVE